MEYKLVRTSEKVWMTAEEVGRPFGAKGIDLGTGMSLFIRKEDADELSTLSTVVDVVDVVTPPEGAPPEDFPEAAEFSAYLRAEKTRCFQYVDWVKNDDLAGDLVRVDQLDDIHGTIVATPNVWVAPEDNSPKLGDKAKDYKWAFHPQKEGVVLVFGVGDDGKNTSQTFSFAEAKEKGILA